MDRLIKVADGFWNVRGSFKVGGLLDVGTQTSLVKLRSGGFVVLDSYALTGEVASQVLAQTNQGKDVRAVLNLHPFHTAHIRSAAKQFPGAQLYGTARHKTLAPELRWEPLTTDDPALHARFAEDLRFSVPRGVDFIPSREHYHFSSVLALHSASGTLHVDDTLSWMSLPWSSSIKFHPTLRFVLQKRPGAAREFRAWVEELIGLCGDVRQLCTAHMRKLPSAELRIADGVRKALAGVSKVLDRHERRYG